MSLSSTMIVVETKLITLTRDIVCLRLFFFYFEGVHIYTHINKNRRAY